MRTHGWSGDIPASDREAMQRIVTAGIECVNDHGDRADLAKVAEALGVTRQTIYRYFPSSQDLFAAVANDMAADVVAGVRRHIDATTSASEAVVEVVMWCVRELPADRRLSFIVRPNGSMFSASGQSALARAVLEDLPIALDELDAQALTDLAEVMFRLLQSLLLDPATADRSDAELRRFLHIALDPLLHG